jgi:hypothetical protein
LSDATPADLPGVLDPFKGLERTHELSSAERVALLSTRLGEMQARDGHGDSGDDDEAGQSCYDEDEDEDDGWETSGDESDK